VGARADWKSKLLSRLLLAVIALALWHWVGMLAVFFVLIVWMVTAGMALFPDE
jgi:hypothetical protein